MYLNVEKFDVKVEDNHGDEWIIATILASSFEDMREEICRILGPSILPHICCCYFAQ